MMSGNKGISSSAREEILSRLRNRLQPVDHPDPWRSRRQYPDLAGQFSKALTAVSGEAPIVNSWKETLDQLDLTLTEINARHVLIDDHPMLAALDLHQRWPGIEWHITGVTGGNSRDFAATADVGISAADAALAETGSVVVNSGTGRSRLTSLMPPVHIALVPLSCLTTDIISWMAGQPAHRPASTTIISGPSKTADIEQTLAVGVHGPGRFIAILFDDSAG